MSRKKARGVYPGESVLFEDFFTSMLNSVTESAFMMTCDGIVLAANDTFVRRMGFKSMEDVIGSDVFSILPEEVALSREKRAEEVVLSGEPVQFEDERSGRRFLNSIYPVYDPSGQVSRFSVFEMDITERKAQEEKLSLLGEMVDMAPASITVHGTDGRFLYANRETLELHGYTEEEFMSIRLQDLDVPESAELIEERLRLIAEKGEVSFESSHYHRDGSALPLYVTAKKLDWKGKPAVLSIATDIRRQKRSEEALRASEELSGSLLQTIPDIVIMTDIYGNITFVNENPLVADMPKENILGENMLSFIAHNDRDRAMENMKLMFVNPLGAREYRLRFNGGLEIDCEVNGDVMRDANSAPVGLVFVVRDVTERKRAEESLSMTLARLRRVTGSVIQVIVSAVELRDPYTAGHQKRVADLARSIASEMGIPRHEAEGIRIAGVIHDLGKISVPSEILSKPRGLNETEFALVKEHPRKGWEILKGIDFEWPIAEMVHQHHERLDGSGYPQGLKGDEIILGARILAVADVVEAMASHRPYRPTKGVSAALEEIASNRGVLYDPEVVDACLRIFSQKNYRLMNV